MSNVLTSAPCVIVARPRNWSAFVSIAEMHADHGMNATGTTGVTGSKRLTPGHLMGALT
jgi:hypothetical protein